MASEIRVNTFKNRSGFGTITVNDDGANFSGIVTAASFSGNVTGNLTGNVTSSSTSTFSSGLNVTGGSVGIGTDNPQATLHLFGSGGAATGNEGIRLQTSQATGGNWISFNDTSRKGYFGYKETSDDGIYLVNEENSHIVLGTNGSERFRIASDGALGIAGANYGTSGQVLTSQGSGSAPQWATAGGITWLTTVDATSDSGNAKTITGIDTNSRMIVVSFYRVSIDAADTNPIYMRVGNGSINSGSNYYWGVSRGISADRVSSATTFYRLIVDDFNSASHTFSGNITLLRTKDSSNPNWSITHSFTEEGGGNEPMYGAGSFTDTLIDRIQFVPNGNFDSGSIRIGYIL